MASLSGLLSCIKPYPQMGQGRFSDKQRGLYNEWVLEIWRHISTPSHLDWNGREVSAEVLSIWKTDSTIRSVLITSGCLVNQRKYYCKMLCLCSSMYTSTFPLIIWLTFKESSFNDHIERKSLHLISYPFLFFLKLTKIIRQHFQVLRKRWLSGSQILEYVSQRSGFWSITIFVK